MPHDDETVGYGRPPKHTRFQTGQSGNRRGRPKGAPNLATALVPGVESPVDAHDPATQPLPEVDQAVMARILSRLTRQAQQGGADHGAHAQPE
jgi:hypothetical protein